MTAPVHGRGMGARAVVAEILHAVVGRALQR
jgi:hypothetical protein